MGDYYPPAGGTGSSTVPTGTGFRRVTSGVEDPTAEPLSAAEIAAALHLGTATGTNAYEVDREIDPQDGDLVTFRIGPANTNTGYSALTTGSVQKGILKPGPAGLADLAGGELVSVATVLLQFSDFNDGWILIAGGALTPGDMPTKLVFEAKVTHGQSIALGAPAKLNLDAAITNTIGTVSASVITIGASGWYIPEAALIGSNGAGVALELEINGGRSHYSQANVSTSGFFMRSSPIYLAGGDAVKLMASANGSGCTINSNAYSFLANFKLLRLL